MPDQSRIEDLRRRVQADPTSIAFAALAEEYRRAGRYQDAVDTCRAGLQHHPGYLSARVTLGRALLELGHLDDAQAELEAVLRAAPENLAAIRGLAEIHHRRGELHEALDFYRTALDLARHDAGLHDAVAQIQRAVEPPRSPVDRKGLSLQEAGAALRSAGKPASSPGDVVARQIALLERFLAAIERARAGQPGAAPP